MRPVVIVAFLVLTLAAILGYVSVGNTYWTSVSAGSVSAHNGLFVGCVNDICSSGSDAADWLKAVQAFCLISVLCLGVNQIVMPFHLCQGCASCPLSHGTLQVMTVLLSAAGGVSMIIAVSIYGAELPDNLDWTFGLACATAVLALIGTALAVFIRHSPAES